MCVAHQTHPTPNPHPHPHPHPHTPLAQPHYPGAAPMRLYQRADLQGLALAKWGSQRGLADRLQRLAAGRDKRRATVAARAPSARGKRSRAEEEEEEEEEGGEGEGNSLQCQGCGNTAAEECIRGCCCHCCKGLGGGCPRHQ